MKYEQDPLPFDEQANILMKRGLLCDKKELISTLERINYYRISGYLYPFISENGYDFSNDVTLDRVMNLYWFDDSLRSLTLKGISIIEVALLRTQLVEYLSVTKGIHCYMDRDLYKVGKKTDSFFKILADKTQTYFESSDVDIVRFKNKYSEEVYLPFWIISEKYSFGTLSHIFSHLKFSDKKVLSQKMSVPEVILESWLFLLNRARNLCAHHARLWNYEFFSIKMPYSHLNTPLKDVVEYTENYENHKVFTLLSIIIYLIGKTDNENEWPNNLKKHLESFPEKSMSLMGFPENWQKYEVWR